MAEAEGKDGGIFNRKRKKEAVDSYTKRSGDPVKDEITEINDTTRVFNEASAYDSSIITERMQDYHSYYGKQVGRYGISAGVLTAGVAAAAVALTGGLALPFVVGGAAVAAGGASGIVATRIRRNPRYDVYNDFHSARVAWRQGVLERAVDRDLALIADAEKRGENAEPMRKRVQKRLDRLDKAAMREYERAEKRYKTILARQERIANGAITSRLSDLAAYLGITRWAKSAEIKRRRAANAVNMHASEMVANNTARAKAGLPANEATNDIVTKFHENVKEARKTAAKNRVDIDVDNAKMGFVSGKEHVAMLNPEKSYVLEEVKERITLGQDEYPDKALLTLLSDPENVPYPETFDAIIAADFGVIYEKDADGKIAVDEKGNPIVKNDPKRNSTEILETMFTNAGEKDFDKMMDIYDKLPEKKKRELEPIVRQAAINTYESKVGIAEKDDLAKFNKRAGRTLGDEYTKATIGKTKTAEAGKTATTA